MRMKMDTDWYERRRIQLKVGDLQRGEAIGRCKWCKRRYTTCKAKKFRASDCDGAAVREVTA